MRILQIFNRYLERGGEEVFVEFTTRELSRRHIVHNLTFRSRDWVEAGVFEKALHPFWMFWNPRSLRQLRDDINSFRPDIVLIHNIFPAGSLQCYQEIMDRGIPLIQYIHNFRPFSVNGYCWVNGRLARDGLNDRYWDEIANGSWQNSRIKTFWFAAVLKTGHLLGIWDSVPQWIAVSEFMRGKFISAGIEPEKITTLRHLISVSKRPEAISSESDVFVYIGRISNEKGLGVLIEAWRAHEGSRNDGRLVIAGSGPLVPWLEEEILSLRRAEYIGFASGEETRKLIASSLAVIIPSVWWEPLGLVVFEAYDQCKPVMAAETGGLLDTVWHGKTGWQHPPGNCAILSEQLAEVLDNKAEAATRGLAGREWLEKNGNPEAWLDGFDRIAMRALHRHDDRKIEP